MRIHEKICAKRDDHLRAVAADRLLFTFYGWYGLKPCFMTLSSATGNSAVAYLGYMGGIEMVPAWTIAVNVTVLIYLAYRWETDKKKGEEP